MRKKIFFVAAMLFSLIAGSSCSSWYDSERGMISVTYDGAANYLSGNFSYDKDSLSVVNIEWRKGDITIKSSSEDTLSVYESGENLTDSERLKYKMEDGALEVRYWKSGYWGRIDPGEKNLTVELPDGAGVRIVSSYGAVNIEHELLSSVDITVQNGNISAGNITCSGLFLSAENGAITLGEAESGGNITLSADKGSVSAEKLAATGEISACAGEITIFGLKANEIYAEALLSSPKITEAECSVFTYIGKENAVLGSLSCVSAKISAAGYIAVNSLSCDKLKAEAAGDITLHLSGGGAEFTAGEKQTVYIYGFDYVYNEGKYTVGDGSAEVKFTVLEKGILSIYKAAE